MNAEIVLENSARKTKYLFYISVLVLPKNSGGSSVLFRVLKVLCVRMLHAVYEHWNLIHSFHQSITLTLGILNSL